MMNIACRPFLGLADQPALRAVVVHDAGGVAVDAHLLLERAATDGELRSPSEPSSFTRNLGTTNSEMPFTLSGAPAILASTRWMMFSLRSCSPDEMKIFVPVIA